MSYTVLGLISDAFYIAGIVSREFQTVQGNQVNDGLSALNDVLGDRVVDGGMIPYYNTYTFTAVTGQEQYFIPNLVEPETLTFYINTVRYQMSKISRRQYYGSSRAENIETLPFTWHAERCVGGTNIWLYFLPNVDYPVRLWGLFSLGQVAINQDLESALTTVNLGQVIFTGNLPNLAIGQFSINNVPIEGTFLTVQELATHINSQFPDNSVVAIPSLQELIITSNINNNNQNDVQNNLALNNLIITTSGQTPDPNHTITFYNFSTINNQPLYQTYFPLQLDRFYINYLKFALAERLCIEYNYEIPDGLTKQLDQYEEWISKKSQVIDLTMQKISTMTQPNSINYAQVNLGRGWTAT